jgi:hypothetical protein
VNNHDSGSVEDLALFAAKLTPHIAIFLVIMTPDTQLFSHDAIHYTAVHEGKLPLEHPRNNLTIKTICPKMIVFSIWFRSRSLVRPAPYI